MDLIKRTISLDTLKTTEDGLLHNEVTATTIHIKVYLRSEYDDMGIPTDMDVYEYSENCSLNTCVDYTVLTNKLIQNGMSFPFMYGITPQNMYSASTSNMNENPGTYYYNMNVDDEYIIAGFVTGYTSDKLNQVRSYIQATPYITGLDVSYDEYLNYLDVLIYGRTRVTDNTNPIIYAIDSNLQYIGTNAQTSGIKYETFNDETYPLIDLDGNETFHRKTEVRYIGEGWNKTNSTLSPYIRKDYLFGITDKPKVESDVFIDRGVITINENHLRMGEIKSLESLLNYGNNYFKFNP